MKNILSLGMICDAQYQFMRIFKDLHNHHITVTNRAFEAHPGTLIAQQLVDKAVQVHIDNTRFLYNFFNPR